ncbi:MAG: hypothetical protein AB7N76_30195 [Planctomycetota bacterium]
MRAHPSLVACVLLACATSGARPEDAELKAKLEAAARQSYQAIDAWVGHAEAIQGKLEGIQEKVKQLETLQDALSGRRDLDHVLWALKEVNPEWEGKLQSLDSVRALLFKHRGTRPEAHETLEGALHALADVAQKINGRALDRWYRSGIAQRIGDVLEGRGAMGRALAAGKQLRSRWVNSVGKYQELLGQVDELFNPEARTAYSGLDAIERILGTFGNKVPGPAGYMIDFLKEAIAAAKKGLQSAQQTLDQNARQMAMTRSLVESQDLHIERYPGNLPPPEELRELKAPAGVPGRFFGYTVDANVYAVLLGTSWHPLFGPLERIQRVALWLTTVRKTSAAAIGELQRYTNDWGRIVEPRIPEFEREIEAALRPMVPTLLKPYLDLLQDSDSYERVIAWRRLPRDLLLATWLLDPTQHALMDTLADALRSHVLVELSFAPDAALDPAQVSVSVASVGYGSAVGLDFSEGAGTKPALVKIYPEDREVEGWATSRATGRVLGRARARIGFVPGKLSLRLDAKAPEEEQPEPEPDQPLGGDDLTGIGAGAGPGEGEGEGEGATEGGATEGGATEGGATEGEGGDTTTGEGEGEGDDELPGVTSEDGQDPEPGEGEGEGAAGGDVDPDLVKQITDQILDDLLDSWAEHSGQDEAGNDTHDRFDPQRPAPGDPRFDDYQKALDRGDVATAATIRTQLTGEGAAASQAAAADAAADAQQDGEFERDSQALDRPDDSPPPPDDAQAARDAGLDPGALDGPVQPSQLPGSPTDPNLLQPPPDQSAANAPAWTRRGDAVRDHVRTVAGQQGQAAQAEASAGQQAVRTWKVPTRGGMNAISAGGAREVILRVWDSGSQDGDRVQIWVGGQVLVNDLSLTNAGHAFRITLRPGFTSIKVIALNEGSAPPNTASMAVTANGRTLGSSGWGLKSYDMGSTVIGSDP